MVTDAAFDGVEGSARRLAAAATLTSRGRHSAGPGMLRYVFGERRKRRRRALLFLMRRHAGPYGNLSIAARDADRESRQTK